MTATKPRCSVEGCRKKAVAKVLRAHGDGYRCRKCLEVDL